MGDLNISVASQSRTGKWNVIAHGIDVDGGTFVRDVTYVRGLPVLLSSLKFTEPFGPANASFSVGGVSPLEPIGSGSSDLWWIRSGTNIDINWSITDEDLASELKAVGHNPGCYCGTNIGADGNAD